MPFDLPETTKKLDSTTKTKNNKSIDSFNGEETKDELVEDSFAERKAGDMASIPPPTLKNNQNALNRQTLPFSFRLFSGALKIDPKDIHAVANQMIFEINDLAGQLLIL